jgi:tRNA A-37 threonylcarbamoyl transferase component Bud32
VSPVEPEAVDALPSTGPAQAELRLRTSIPALVDLPWLEPLAEWSPADVPFRDIPVGPSRHLVRFVHADGRLYALKELPFWAAEREYDALRAMQRRGLPAVRPAGLAVRPAPEQAVLITEYLAGSWQYRRLLMRIPLEERKHRARLFDAVAGLLVELHRHGVFWGDCSLANTLFRRDGQVVQAYLVDAETAEVHASLTRGQREHDLDVLEENVGGGLMDLALRLEQPEEVVDELLAEARGVRDRYQGLWDVLHEEPTFSYRDRSQTATRIGRLNDLGFAVDEVRLVQVSPGREEVRLNAVVADRRFHADELHRLTGLDVGEGQARLLLNDLHSFAANRYGRTDSAAAQAWLREVYQPALARLRQALPHAVDVVQAYCDLLEVRWLMSEQAGGDVGDDAALTALVRRQVPRGSAAEMATAELETDTAVLRIPVVTDDL